MLLSEALAIIGLIALVGFVILAVFSIIALYNAIIFLKDANKNISIVSITITDSIKTLTHDVSLIKEKVIDTMVDLDKFTLQATSLTQKIETETESIVKTFQPYQQLLQRAYNSIAPPIITFSGIASGITKFVSVFSNRMFKK
jgi:hypothetical protein